MKSEGKNEIVREELSFGASSGSVVRQGSAEQPRAKG